MSAPRKKLSGAEYRKKAKNKLLQKKQLALKMKNWISGGGDPSASAATSEVDIQFEDIFCTLPDQTDEDFSPIVAKHTTSSDLRAHSLSSSSMCEEELEGITPKYEEPQSAHLDSDELLKTGCDLTDPGNWPDMEKMTDQQRSFFSSQAVLLERG